MGEGSDQEFGYAAWLLMISLLVEMEEGGALTSEHVHSIVRRAIELEKLQPAPNHATLRKVWVKTAKALGVPRKKRSDDEAIDDQEPGYLPS